MSGQNDHGHSSSSAADRLVWPMFAISDRSNLSGGDNLITAKPYRGLIKRRIKLFCFLFVSMDGEVKSSKELELLRENKERERAREREREREIEKGEGQ